MSNIAHPRRPYGASLLEDYLDVGCPTQCLQPIHKCFFGKFLEEDIFDLAISRLQWYFIFFEYIFNIKDLIALVGIQNTLCSLPFDRPSRAFFNWCEKSLYARTPRSPPLLASDDSEYSRARDSKDVPVPSATWNLFHFFQNSLFLVRVGTLWYAHDNVAKMVL